MLRTSRSLLLAASALLLTSRSSFAQDVDKILGASVKASGGAAKLRKVLTLSIEGTLTRESDGKSGAYTLNLKSPNRYYAEFNFAGQPEIFAYNGKSGWHEDAK